jgi:recombination protein RecR
MSKSVIENLTKIISRLPSMGPRIAKKITLELANNKEKTLVPLINYLNELKDKVFNCEICGNIDEGKICKICLDESRSQEILCVVEEVGDLIAIEKSKNFNGKYHVLGGNLSAISGKTIDDLNFSSLIRRVKNGNFQEIIIATGATIDGQNTAHFIVDNLQDFNVKITRLGYGIPIGSDIDYLDEGTISIALKSRMAFE